MKTFCLSLALVAVCSLLIGSVPMTAQSASTLTPEKNGMSEATHKELARARSATAKYHDIAQAEAEGYVNFDLYESGKDSTTSSSRCSTGSLIRLNRKCCFTHQSRARTVWS